MIMKVALHVEVIMKTKQNKPIKSTYEEFMEDPKRRALFHKEYAKLELSELLIEAMEKADLTVRKLAEEADVSPTTIQELRSGKKTNISLTTFNRVLDTLGYEISINPKK